MTSQNSEDSLTKQGITSEIVEEPDEGEYSSLRDQSKDYTLTLLNENHKHYKSISGDFEKCGSKVSKIQQLLNPEREKDYSSQKKNIKDARKKFYEGYELNEKYLYHGTTAKDINEEILALGLDEKFTKGNGHFGKGIYLSDSPSFFVNQAKLKDGHERSLLCVRAILGDIKVYAEGEQDRKLNREPEKEGKFEGHRFYDSVQGRHNNLNEYVVYSAQRLIIEYLINYHKSTQDAEPEKLEVTTANVVPADGAVADDSDSRSNSPDPKELDSDDSSDENEIKIKSSTTDDNSSSSEDEEERHSINTDSDTGSEAEDEAADSTGSPHSDSEDEDDIDFLKRQGITCQEVEDDPELDDTLNNAYRLVPLDNNHNHHKEISAEFKKSHLHILSIEKVENPIKLKEYKSAKDIMLDRVKSSPDFKINETYLYHGTKVDIKELCEFGLDDKLAGKNGRFGQGIYLSDELGKCVVYTKCKKEKENEGTILCVRALLGDIKVYADKEQDKSLAREPKKPEGHKGWGFYDSVKGRPKDMTEYVVYRAARLFIQYVITFSKGSKYKRRDFPDGSSSQKLSDTCHAPGEELSPEGVALRDQFKKKTGETKNNVAEAYLWATCNTIDVAVDIYINKDKIEEEINKIREELKEQGDNSDADMTFHPKGVPTYNSPEWKALSEDKAQEHIENFLTIFMAATEIDIKYKDIAQEFLKNKEYDIDQTLLAFYGSI